MGNPMHAGQACPDQNIWGIKKRKANLDIFWLRDESMEDSANLPARDVPA